MTEITTVHGNKKNQKRTNIVLVTLAVVLFIIDLFIKDRSASVLLRMFGIAFLSPVLTGMIVDKVVGRIFGRSTSR